MKNFDVNLIKINAVFNQNPYMPTEEAIYTNIGVELSANNIYLGFRDLSETLWRHKA